MSNLAAGGRQWVLMPWYLGQLLTAAKSFEANPLLGSPRLNELGLHRKRVILADRLAQRRAAPGSPIQSARTIAGRMNATVLLSGATFSLKTSSTNCSPR